MNKILGLFLVAGLLFVSAANVSATPCISQDNGCTSTSTSTGTSTSTRGTGTGNTGNTGNTSPVGNNGTALNNSEQPLRCCVLGSDVSLDGVDYIKGQTVGGDVTSTCSLNNGGVSHSQSKKWGLICVLGSVGSVSNLIFAGLMVLVPLMIIIGAYFIMTAGVNPDRIKTGKNYIIWAAIGLVVGLFLNAIPGFVSSLFSG